MKYLQELPGASIHAELKRKIDERTIVAAICGLGYVGLPLASTIVAKGMSVIGIDIDPDKIQLLKNRRSYIRHISSETIARMQDSGRFRATDDFTSIGEADIVAICVPTPLGKHREPDLSYIIETARRIAAHGKRGQLIVLESTTYPGTTEQVLAPIFAERGLVSGNDIFFAFSPEREDPGNPDFNTTNIPKIVGGIGEEALELAVSFYSQFVGQVIPVSSPSTAEAVKLTENIFRSVNIALVNELKTIFHKMGIDIWEVIDAASTKPFGFMPFYPGPGLGGHCIPIDPFYLSWKAHEFETTTRLIQLAGEINTSMPGYVIGRLTEELDMRFGKGLNGSRVLMIGLAYKKNVGDVRESPSLKLMEMLEARGASVEYHDPFVQRIPNTREHGNLAGRDAVELDEAVLSESDVTLIATDHDPVDYAKVVEHSRLVVDTRNVCARLGIISDKITKA